MHTICVLMQREVRTKPTCQKYSFFFLNQINQPVHVFTYDKENGSVCPVYGLKGTGAK